MQCPRCQYENPPQSSFCLECGGRLTITCGSCGAALPSGSRFCNYCGTPVQSAAASRPRLASPEAYTPKHLAAKILTSRSALEGERKHVTVLFADLKGSMELLADAAPGTIRRELGTLIRMLRLAYQNGKLVRLPMFQKPKEGAPRAGFFERQQYEAVRRHLRADLAAVVAVAYTYGWRVQSEVLTLERRQLDLEAATLRLDPGMTKNDEGRVVYLTPELRMVLAEQLDRVRDLERRMGRIVPSLFPHLRGRFRGRRITDFRKTWAAACRRAGVPGRSGTTSAAQRSATW